MKVQEFMERVGTTSTGRAIAYIKDAMEDINIYSGTHITTERIGINSGQRFYNFPNDMIKILDIRAKNHNNSENAYRSIPRLTYEPKIKDSDGE